MTKEEVRKELARIDRKAGELQKVVGELKEALTLVEGELQPEPERELVHINEVHAMGGPHPNTLRRLIRAKKLPGFIIGRKFYVSRSDLKEIMSPTKRHFQ